MRKYTKPLILVLLVVVALLVNDWRETSRTGDVSTTNINNRSKTDSKVPITDKGPFLPSKRSRLEPQLQELSSHPSFDLFNDALRANRELLSWAGLKPDQFDQFDDYIEKKWNEFSLEIESEAILVQDDPGDPNPRVPGEKDVKVFTVEASPTRADQRISQLKEELASMFGEGAARRLTPYISRENYMGAFGRHGMKIKFYREVKEDFSSVNKAIVEVIDPATGNTIARLSGYISKRIYGYIGTAFGKSDGP